SARLPNAKSPRMRTRLSPKRKYSRASSLLPLPTIEQPRRIQQYVQVQNGYRNEGLNQVPTFKWIPIGEEFIGVIDERMPDAYEAGGAAVVTLYKIGHTNDSSRRPLFTTSQEKAVHYYSN